MFVSCGKDDNPVTPVNPPVSGAYIVGTATYSHYRELTNYNFLYPSTDPYGNTVMLSGTISMGSEVTKDKPALGLVLYNHYSIFKADECPSKGKLDMPDKMRGSGFIVVSPDGYGFGSTENKPQAYCMAGLNARASVDALLAARELLTQMGYHFGDALINIGYSQGAQTAIGVLRYISQKNLDIHFTRTIAGAGPYDLTETYCQLIEQDAVGKSSNAVSVLLAYNEYGRLGLTYEEMFREPVLSHINDWILSKQYSREQIDEKIGEVKLTDCLAPVLADMESSISQSLIRAFNRDDLCTGWTPRHDESILLFHSTIDSTVPPYNTTLLYQFLTEQGVENVELDVGKYGAISPSDPHTFASLTFISHTKDWICTYFGIPEW